MADELARKRVQESSDLDAFFELPHPCECPTAPQGHSFAKHPSCEYFEHHCDGCHHRKICTASPCLKDFDWRDMVATMHHCESCHEARTCTRAACTERFKHPISDEAAEERWLFDIVAETSRVEDLFKEPASQ